MCLLYLLLTFCCVQCLDRLGPLDYDFDDDSQNSFHWNKENRKNCFRISKGHNISKTMINQEQPGLHANGIEILRVRRSCGLPEAAFIFKQVMLPESDVKTFTSVCKEPDMMNLLQFQRRKETVRWPIGLNDYGNSEESIDDNGMIFKEAIGFEIPEASNSGSKGKAFQKGNMENGVENRMKCRIAHDIRSNRANVAIEDILARVQTVEKLKGRARREIRYRKFRATPKPRLDSFETSLGKSRAITNNEESKPQKRLKEKTLKSNRPWQEKLWDNIRRSSTTHQKQSPISSAAPSSSYSWKSLHIKSRSVTTSTRVPNHSAKYSFRRFFSKNRSAESQPRAMHFGNKFAPTKLNARRHKGHNCHYHYKNHRIREQQAFHRLKANTKQFWCTPGYPDEESSTSQTLDEGDIMSTLGMDLLGPTHQDVEPAATETPETTMPTHSVWTHFQRVQTTVTERTVTPQTFATTAAPRETTTVTPTTESPTTISASTKQIETTTTQLATYLTTINMNYMTGVGLTTEESTKEVDVKDDESAKANVPSEVETTFPSEAETTINYVHRKRFRKT